MTLNGNASWGIGQLDRAFGCLERGRVHVVGARPACGKTTLALWWLDQHMERLAAADVATFWAMPRRVLAFLTERSSAVARRTWAAMRAHCLSDDVVAGHFANPEQERCVRAEEERVAAWEAQGWVRFADVTSPTVQQVNDLATQHDPSIVLFDYLQRVRPTGAQDRFAAVAALAQWMAVAATAANGIVLAFSQLKRRGDGVLDKYRPPFLEDFKLSGEIEEVADVALGLFRPLRRLTRADEAEIRAGHCGLERWQIADAMAVKCVKHRWRGPASDVIRTVGYRDGWFWDSDGPRPRVLPVDAGDAYEGPELPF